MTNCTHKWKHFEPKVKHWYDGYSTIVTLTYTDWCEECYLVKERTQDYRETTIIEED